MHRVYLKSSPLISKKLKYIDWLLSLSTYLLMIFMYTKVSKLARKSRIWRVQLEYRKGKPIFPGTVIYFQLVDKNMRTVHTVFHYTSNFCEMAVKVTVTQLCQAAIPDRVGVHTCKFYFTLSFKNRCLKKRLQLTVVITY